jgi:hypothetical protein
MQNDAVDAEWCRMLSFRRGTRNNDAVDQRMEGSKERAPRIRRGEYYVIHFLIGLSVARSKFYFGNKVAFTWKNKRVSHAESEVQ